ncbi:MAG: hypothetical protein WCI27_00180 [Candidatus Omnitrophota bacterium]
MIENIWSRDIAASIEYGVTSFKILPDKSPEDMIINQVETIDLHHGVYSYPAGGTPELTGRIRES